MKNKIYILLYFIFSNALWSQDLLAGLSVYYPIDSQQSDSLYSDNYDVMAHQETAMNILLGWGGLSTASGTAMLFSKSKVTRGFGIQNIAWGIIDAGIAVFAKNSITNKKIEGFDPQKERESFRNILLINTLLDIVYIGVGTWLAFSEKDKVRGHGYGIILQGSFLFIFDGINYLLTF